jgi:hypothetical protein
MTPTMTRYTSTAALLAIVGLAACDKTAVQQIDGPADPTTMSQVRFFNFGVGGPSINFYANTTKMTATSSALCTPAPTDATAKQACLNAGQEATTGVAYGGVGSGGLYAGLAPGQYTLKGTIAANTDKDLAVASLQTTLEANKIYSFYVSGFYNTTAKTEEAFIVEDPIPALDWAKSPVRFVNAISNSSPMTLIARDSSTKTETTIATTLAYKSAGAFVALPPGLYEFYATVAGSATKVIQRTGVTLAAGRIYSLSSRGDATATTGTNARQLDFTANR